MIARFRECFARCRSLFTRRECKADFDEELSAHLDLAIEDNIRQGMSPEEARRQALVSLGGVDQAKELHWRSRGLPALETILRDVRYAVRTLRRDTALATFAILIVGLGVGAGSIVFNLFNALLLRPLPFENPSRLVWIANSGEQTNLADQAVQTGNLQDFLAQNQSFSEVAGFSPFYAAGDIQLGNSGEPERLTGVPVTENFFRVLGIQPQLGRFFTPEETTWAGGGPDNTWRAAKVVVLSHDFWKRRYAADPGILGHAITLDNSPAIVVGVLPASFDFSGIFTPGRPADLFLPFPNGPEVNRYGNTLVLVGRLKPGATLGGAQAEATLIGARIEREHTRQERNLFHPNLSALRERVSGSFRHVMQVVACAVGVLVLLVCANLSNLLLARASARRKEMAIRAALGAGRRRMIQQMLFESLLLSFCGAALGLALALGGTSVLAHLQDTKIPLLQHVRVDGAALGFTLLAAVVTGILFGIVPALQVSGTAPHHAMKVGGHGTTRSGGGGWVRNSLVVCEITLACLLLTCAGLLMRSLLRVLDVNLGFETDTILALRIDQKGRNYAAPSQRSAEFDRILQRVRSVHGVEAASLTDALPLGENFGWRMWTVKAKGQAGEDERKITPLVRVVNDGYLETMRIPLRAGRTFTEADNASAPGVMIVNETLAHMLWPGQNPLGQSLTAAPGEMRVIGVVQDVRYFGHEKDAGPEMYMPIRQMDPRGYRSVDLVIRSSRPLPALMPDLRASLKSADPGLPTGNFRTMRQLVDRALFARRSVVLLLAGFALFALLLAMLGVYGVISYSVTQRKQEIGIRAALGASRGHLQVLILSQTGRLAVAGILLGAVVSWIAAHALQALLFGVKPSDPATFAGVLAVLAMVAALAGYLPARRASRLDPLDALRCE